VIFQIFQLQFQLQLFLVTIRVNGFLVTIAVILIFVNNRVFKPSTKCNNITISTCEHITMCSSVFFQECHSWVTKTVIFINSTCNWLSGMHGFLDSLSVDSFPPVKSSHTENTCTTYACEAGADIGSWVSVVRSRNSCAPDTQKSSLLHCYMTAK